MKPKNIIYNVIYLILTLITLVAGYLFLRLAYHASDNFPFTQEIVLIFLGTLATVFITALLLNKQTAVEIEKEQNIRYFELKTVTYRQLLDLLQEMSLVDKFSEKEIIQLQFITHKLAVIASAEVLEAYGSLLKTIKKIAIDKSFDGDMRELHESVAALTVKIRHDILGVDTIEDEGFSQERISEIISANINENIDTLDG